MRWGWIGLLFLTMPLQAEGDGEAFAVRRILSLWKDGDYSLVEKEIHRFFREHPASDQMEALQVVLGDAAMEQGEWDNALEAYQEVVSVDLYKKAFPNIIKARFELGDYSRVIELAEQFLPKEDAPLSSPAEQAAAYYWSQVQMDREEWYEAESILLRLLATPYREQGQLALATVYRSTDRKGRAARVYKELAEEHPNLEEIFLFQAAQLEKEEPDADYLGTLRRVQGLRGKRANDAAWQEVVRLVDRENKQELLDRRAELSPLLSEERRLLLSFYEGRYLIDQERFRDGLEALEPFVENGAAAPAYHQAALLTGIAAAGKVGDVERARAWAERFEEIYPDEPERPQALFLRAMANKKAGHREAALLDLNRLRESFPKFGRMDDVQFERCLVLYELGRYAYARQEMLAFLEEHSESPYTNSAYQYVVAASLKVFDATVDREERVAMVDQITDDLELAFAKEEESQDKKAKYLLRLAHANVQMERYEEAIALLDEAVKISTVTDDLYQGYLLLATSFRASRNDLVAYVHFAEKALELKPADGGKFALKRNLFTAYTKMASADEAAREDYHERAAGHLYEVFREEPESLEQGQLLWLADFYINSIEFDAMAVRIEEMRGEKREIALRALALMEAAFGSELELGEETVRLEGALVKWARLLGWMGRHEMELNILEQLVLFQREHPDWNWKYSDAEMLSLASLYIQSGKLDEAAGLLDELVTKRRPSRALSQRAKLLWARLTFRQIPQELRHSTHYRVQTIQDSLRELQAQRYLEQEPLHLEAGIDLAAIRASLAPEHERVPVLLTALREVKEEFTQTDDLVARDYHSQRENNPTKDRIYQAYMMLIDAHINYAQYLAEQEAGNPAASRRRLEAAATIFETLVDGKFAVSKYLIDQATWALQAIREGRSPLISERGTLSPGGIL